MVKKLGLIPSVEQQFIDENKLAEIISFQCGIPHVGLRLTEIDKNLITKDALRWCAEHHFFFRLAGGKDPHARVSLCDPPTVGIVLHWCRKGSLGRT